jgi:hypothetical protein
MPRPGFKYLDDKLDPGYVLKPQGDHLPKLSADKQRAEVAIRGGDPRGALRANAVFVFEDRSVAEALLGETPGEHLYEVAVEEGDILHRGDLRIYDEIVDALKHKAPVDALVKEFWAGVERPRARNELVVSKATIRRKLVDDAEKERAAEPQAS